MTENVTYGLKRDAGDAAMGEIEAPARGEAAGQQSSMSLRQRPTLQARNVIERLPKSAQALARLHKLDREYDGGRKGFRRLKSRQAAPDRQDCVCCSPWQAPHHQER
jgi:hypothetical protein